MDPSDLIHPPALRQDQVYQLCKTASKWGLLLALCDFNSAPMGKNMHFKEIPSSLHVLLYLRPGPKCHPLSQLFCTWGWSVQVTCCIFLPVFWSQVLLEGQAHLGVSTCDLENQGDCRQWQPVLVSGSELSAHSELGKDGTLPIKMTHNEWLENRYQHKTLNKQEVKSTAELNTSQVIPDSGKPYED